MMPNMGISLPDCSMKIAAVLLIPKKACLRIIIKGNLLGANGTVAALVTNGKFTPAELSQIAAMAQTGLARAIRPAHTLVDDDSVYALSAGIIEADVNIAGTLAVSVLARAINRAVLQAEPVFGLTVAKTMKNGSYSFRGCGLVPAAPECYTEKHGALRRASWQQTGQKK